MRIVRKTLGLLVTLLVTSFVVFAAMFAAPGDPAAFLVGGPDKATPENLAAVRAEYHLDESLPAQYWHWLTGVLQGDLGRSFHYDEHVLDLIAARAPTTLLLVAYATVLFVLLGVGLGALAAVRRGAVDSAVVTSTTLASSIPQFVVAIALVSLFAVQLGWFPVSGTGTGLLGTLYHLTLPALSLALGAIAITTRITRQTMVEQFSRDHVEAARAAGLSERAIVWRHVFRNALGPVLTMCGLITASLLAGTVVVETAFGISGVGSLLVNAINTQDFPITQAVLLLMVAAYVLVTTLIDLAYPLLDPRVRAERSAL
ncbi:ABC transporter permease [Amycolatopsis suaedae]|uniref:ABC transporter permease n=1 Tax=Amycolatopsis suaedae TaxID=2510978 RepID=A0A4Q7J0G3_9PSEU|nr:ABC transporter permease [Amycolatopsis suaedae]RZQ60831.1 ABC transporter permease [Amycolatopsis suaedae]